MDDQQLMTPPDVFPREDPTGYSIWHTEEGWVAVRLVDSTRVEGAGATREDAIDLAIEDSDTPTGYAALAYTDEEQGE